MFCRVDEFYPQNYQIIGNYGKRIPLRGNCTPEQKNSMFGVLSQKFNTFLKKIIYASNSKLSKELNNSIEI